MASRFPIGRLPVLALVACLALVAEAHAQGRKPPPPPDKKAQEEAARKAQEAARKQAEHVAHMEMLFQEAHNIRQAIILLDKGNHDYDGHRVKAIAKAREAEKVLADHVLKHGTAQQKQATITERKAVAAADEENRRNSTLHERQKRSDDQLRDARKLLHAARDTLAQHKQEEPLGHVRQAIKHLDIALEIR